ncbi:AraC family transcriptional regulator [Lederbergia citrea]|uniref:Helix-turn-helix transcriptional regulator n=1 Tax=Lederbergia citrea TaxID=2833581 RepID=A0A942Z6H2_9BACI|nr:AraC family transcriptional regulator [Lederbergia citrea]MBS4179392.1 helix-turn-helix transcriptional regulator [Lederbergia citrea]MBS4206061.1 helix-turn-helix transcriptional regulator [Lederbergia citrea]MBS4224490.1 helix-turn-helix transcriptional regulator [Lederbergia citrea]
MVKNETYFSKKYIANAQLDVLIVQRTKVPTTWGETDFIPEFNKFYFIQSGTGFVKVDGQVYYPNPGELYLLPAGTKQSYGITSGNTYDKFWCHFSAKVGEAHLYDLVEAPLFIKVKHPEKIKEQFEQLIRLNGENSIASLFEIHAILLQLIALMLENGGHVKSQSFSNPSFEKIDHVINYVEAHLAESLSIEEMAAIAGFHPNYFIQLFKQFTGTSPIRFLNQLRMERARHLLATTNRSISEIADMVGIEVSYFSRMFREQIGFAPSQYREMIVHKK